MSAFSRRSFLQTAAATTLAAGYTATSRGYAANETISVGCIGTGGRCRKLMESLNALKGAKIVAVCDIWDQHLADGKKLADPNAFATKEYERLLERKDIDAVIIGTPDHWHVPLTIAACAAGKDVYVEKPLTHDLSEGAAVINAQNKHKRVVQVGTQQRSMTHLIEARDLLKSGALGKIVKIHLTWNRNQDRIRVTKFGVDPKTVDWKRFLGNAKDQPFEEFRFRQWRWFWDFGGGIFTDLMVHWIDVAHWFLDLDHPAVATSIGDWLMAKDIWETPDSVQTIMQYPEHNLQAYFEGTFSNARNGAMLELMGSEGTLYVDRGRYEVIPERNKRLQPKERIMGTLHKGADFSDVPDGEALHLSNWLQCIRTRKTPNSPAESGVSSASAAHMANLALRSGQVTKWPGK